MGKDGDESAEDVEEVGVHQPIDQVLSHQHVKQSAELVFLQDLTVLLEEVQNLKDVSALLRGKPPQDADTLVGDGQLIALLQTLPVDVGS